MDISVFIFSILSLQLLCFWIGKRASKKLDSQEDYFLAGRNVRFFPLFMTLIATQIGGGLVLGSAEEAYRYGWYIFLYPLGATLGLLLLAGGIGSRLSRLPVATVAGLFETVYQSSLLKKVASLLSIVSLFMILIAQFIASKKFMLGLGIEQEWLFLAFWSIVILYTVTGGLKAVVATDIVQAFFFIVVFVACFIYSLLTYPEASLAASLNALAGTFEFDQEKWSGWLLMPLLFMVIEQDMAQRCFAAKSGRVVSWASGCAAMCILLICAIPIYYGVLGKSLGIAPDSGASVLMTVLQATTNPTLSALFGCAILVAIISTADSLLNAISSNVAQDFNWQWVGKRWSVLQFFKGVSAGIGVLALATSYAFNNVVDVLILSYELSVVCLFVPVMAALFISRKSSLAAGGAILFGACSFLLVRWVPSPWVPREVLGLLFSAIGFVVGEFLAKRIVSEVSVSVTEK